MSAPAGWHPQDDGRERYWDGTAWTDEYRPATPQSTRPVLPQPQQTTTPPARSGSPKVGGVPRKHLIGYGATALVALLIGAGMGSSGGDAGAASASGGSTPTVTETSTSTVTTTATVTSSSSPTATVVKTVQVKVTPTPTAAITEGTWEVGVDIAPGKYKVIEAVTSDCYWSITKTGTDSIVNNDIVTGGRPVVTLRKGQTFTTQGCGDWAKVG